MSSRDIHVVLDDRTAANLEALRKHLANFTPELRPTAAAAVRFALHRAANDIRAKGATRG